MRPEKAGLINQAPTEIISLDFLHFLRYNYIDFDNSEDLELGKSLSSP